MKACPHFDVYDGRDDAGEPVFDSFTASRTDAAQYLRELRRDGAYIERTGRTYYVEHTTKK